MDIIQKMQSICQPGSFLFHQFHLFVLKTASLAHVSLSKEIYMETAKYVMTTTKESSLEGVEGKDIDEYITNFNKQNDKNQAFIEYSDEERGVLLLKMMKKNVMDYNEIDEIFKFAELSAYTEVLIYLLELRKEYSKCVRNFINCSSLEVKKKVFPWLNTIIKDLTESEREQLKNNLMTYLNQLVEIDSDQTAKFVTEWYQNKHLEIVRKLNNAPKLQMKYLGELVKDPIDEDLVFKYVVLLCQHEPKKVLRFLENREDYNFDLCLNECMKYKVIEAAAFLNEKLGNIKDALDLLINRAERNKYDYLHNTKASECIDDVENDIKQSIALCARNVSRLDSTEIEEYYFAVLKAILELYRDFREFFPINPGLEKKIHACIKEVLEQMMSLVDFNKIISFIIEKFDKIPFKLFKENIFQLLSQHSYQKNIVKRAINLLTSDVKCMTTSLFNFRSRGVISQNSCMQCNQTLKCEKREKMIIFLCGHGFHKKCLKESFCLVCFTQESRKGRGIIVESNSLSRN